MDWNYEIAVTLQHPVNVTVSYLGQQVQLRLVLKAGASTPGTIQGGIGFECQTPPFIDGCFCLMHNLRRRDPAVTTRLETDVYEVANIVGGATGAVVPQWISLEAPTIQLSSSMQVTATNAGRSYNVHIESTLHYTPGKVIIDPPDLENVPLPPPFNAVTIPIGPFPFSLGSPVTIKHRAEYLISCCTWTARLAELPVWDETQTWTPAAPTVLEEGADGCGCDDYSVVHVASSVEGDTQLASWRIKALEGPCRWAFGTEGDPSGPGGGRPVKRDTGGKTQRAH